MVDAFLSTVACRPKLGEPIDRGLFAVEPVEGPDRGVEAPPGTLQRALSFAGVVLHGSPALRIGERGPYRVRDDLLHDCGADRHAARAVARGGAAVEEVRAVVRRADDH